MPSEQHVQRDADRASFVVALAIEIIATHVAC
jgi:hypothetical protein